jgi:hypothetical protein
MKSIRVVPFVFALLVGCSSAPVDLGDPGRSRSQQEDGDKQVGDRNGVEGDDTTLGGPGTNDPTLPSGEPELVLDTASLGAVAVIRDLDLSAGTLYYSALQNDGVALFRYDIASKANVAIGGEHAGEPFAADSSGVFYFGVRPDSSEKAILGIPTTSVAPQWLSSVPTYATAVAVDTQNVYWVERGELTTNFRVARREPFASSPVPTSSYGPAIRLGADFFRHLIVDEGIAYAAGDHGMLIKYDIELATTMLTEQGPKNGFVVSGANLYWIDGAALKSLPKNAAKDTPPSTIASLPADASNVIGGIGPKGIYVLSHATTGNDGRVLRVDPTSAAQKELATNLTGLGSGIFRENAFYFVTSQGVMRLADQ